MGKLEKFVLLYRGSGGFFCLKETLWCNSEIIADFKEVAHGRIVVPGFYGINVIFISDRFPGSSVWH